MCCAENFIHVLKLERYYHSYLGILEHFSAFNFTQCPCLPGCISVHFDVETISYGLWRQNLIIPNDDMKLSSFMITGKVELKNLKRTLVKVNQQKYLMEVKLIILKRQCMIYMIYSRI